MADVAKGFDRSFYLQVRAQALCVGLEARLNEYALDFPGGAPKRAIELIKALLDAIQEEIRVSRDERAIILICGVVRGMGTLLQYLDNAHTAQTPRGLPQMLSSLMTKLNPMATLVAWPQSEYNYSIRDLSALLKEITQNLLQKDAHRAVFDPVEGPLNFVSFPRIERDNVLLHAIFGHELGHPIATQFLEQEKSTQSYSASLLNTTNFLMSHFGLSTDANGALVGSQTQFKDYVNGLQRVLILRTRGLQELISDGVGIMLFGPSALFASYDTLSLGNLDEAPAARAYPPRRFRLRCIKRLLDSEGYAESLEMAICAADAAMHGSLVRYMKHFNDLISQEPDKANLSADPLLKLAYDWIEETLPLATDYIRTRLAGVTYAPSRIVQEVPELIGRLRIQVPPSEIGVPPNSRSIDWRSSLVAGWAYRLHMSEDPAAGSIASQERSEVLNRLVLRAVEFTILSDEYTQFIDDEVTA